MAVLCAWTPHDDSAPAAHLAAATQTACAARAPPGGHDPHRPELGSGPPASSQQQLYRPLSHRVTTRAPSAANVTIASRQLHTHAVRALSRPFLKPRFSHSLRYPQLRDLHADLHVLQGRTPEASEAGASPEDSPGSQQVDTGAGVCPTALNTGPASARFHTGLSLALYIAQQPLNRRQK